MIKNICFLLLVIFVNSLQATSYYIRPTGKNSNNGTSANSAWEDLTNINTKVFVAGDIINLEQGFTYNGKIYFDEADGDTALNPVTLTSWNSKGLLTGRATINAGLETGIFAYNTAGLIISDLNIYGNNLTGDGISFYCELPNNIKKDYLLIQNIEVKGFRNGISLGSWNGTSGYTNVTIKNVESHDNLDCGIVTYSQTRLAHKNANISYCKTFNNLGDMNKLNVSSGSGIILSGFDGGNINNCIAYNNGANNGHVGAGPCAIWCYESNNIIIEHNEAYNNKAGKDCDGGGFDIDGGSTNCIMQYNYSHGNEGAGFLFAQFKEATFMNNNTCRYNISENDGKKNNYGGIMIWAAIGNTMSNTYIYGNTIFSSPAPSGSSSAIGIIWGTVTTNTIISNNIFFTSGDLKLIDAYATSGITFKGNNYWSSTGNFNFNWDGILYNNLSNFKTSGQESGTGLQVDPLLINPNCGITIGNTNNLSSLKGYQLKIGSPMINSGLAITNAGARDFYGNSTPLEGKYDIGANEFKASDIEAPTSPVLSLSSKATNLVSLAWTTSTDNIGVAGYNVYNGINKVNSSLVLKNSYVVTGLSSNTVYNFTVKAVDAAGNLSSASNVISVTLNPITGIEKIDFENTAKIFPNPTTGLINIYVDNENRGELKLKIFNQVGEEVYHFMDNKNQNIFSIDLDLNPIPSGLYYIEIYNDKFKTVRKIIKN